MDPRDYHRYKGYELQSELKRRGLPVTGLVVDLRRRLRENDRVNDSQPSSQDARTQHTRGTASIQRVAASERQAEIPSIDRLAELQEQHIRIAGAKNCGNDRQPTNTKAVVKREVTAKLGASSQRSSPGKSVSRPNSTSSTTSETSSEFNLAGAEITIRSLSLSISPESRILKSKSASPKEISQSPVKRSQPQTATARQRDRGSHVSSTTKTHESSSGHHDPPGTSTLAGILSQPDRVTLTQHTCSTTPARTGRSRAVDTGRKMVRVSEGQKTVSSGSEHGLIRSDDFSAFAAGCAKKLFLSAVAPAGVEVSEGVPEGTGADFRQESTTLVPIFTQQNTFLANVSTCPASVSTHHNTKLKGPGLNKKTSAVVKKTPAQPPVLNAYPSPYLSLNLSPLTKGENGPMPNFKQSPSTKRVHSAAVASNALATTNSTHLSHLPQTFMGSGHNRRALPTRKETSTQDQMNGSLLYHRSHGRSAAVTKRAVVSPPPAPEKKKLRAFEGHLIEHSFVRCQFPGHPYIFISAGDVPITKAVEKSIRMASVKEWDFRGQLRVDQDGYFFIFDATEAESKRAQRLMERYNGTECGGYRLRMRLYNAQC